jgi:phosphorylase kinase alpha/beta subunit
LIDQLKGELNYIRNHWHAPGRPTLAILITNVMLKSGSDALLALIQELKMGNVPGYRCDWGQWHNWRSRPGENGLISCMILNLNKPHLQNAIAPRYLLKFDPEQSYPISHTQEFILEYETDIHHAAQ